jgi:hypothetical protein
MTKRSIGLWVSLPLLLLLAIFVLRQVENERVRVAETRIKPGERNEMKMRGDRINIYITAAKQRVHYADGRTEHFDQEAGSVRFKKAGISSTENIGMTESHSVIVNLK